MTAPRQTTTFANVDVARGPVMFGDQRRIVAITLHHHVYHCDVTFSLRGRNHCLRLVEAWKDGQPRQQFLDYFYRFHPDIDGDTYGVDSSATARQQRACVMYCAWDVLDCIGQLMTGQGPAVLGYATWYLTQWYDTDYRTFVTRLACKCIVKHELRTASPEYQLQEFDASVPV